MPLSSDILILKTAELSESEKLELEIWINNLRDSI